MIVPPAFEREQHMSKFTLAALCGVLLASPALLAQDSQPTRPMLKLSGGGEQPAAEKAKVYDENADARQQIAAAVAKAKKENRRVLIQWGGNWCPWCLKLNAMCKTDKAVSKTLLYEYDVVHVDAGQNDKNMDLAKSYGAKIDGFPFLTILDADGKPVINQNTPPFEVEGTNVSAGYKMAKLNDFLVEHQAKPLNAQAVLDTGLAEAKKSGKRVFLHFGAPWCGWCHKLEDWMARPEIEQLMGKAFVDIKIDVDRMVGGADMKSKLTGGKEGGIPWFVIMDASGKVLATSDGPKGNVGFPYKQEEVAHFAAMIEKSDTKLTKADIETLTKSLNANRIADEQKKNDKN